MKVAIVGLGLMGGSFALSVKKVFPTWEFLGYDHNKSHQKEAIKFGLVDKIAENFDEVKKCDVIVLAIPVDGIIKCLQDLKEIDKQTTIIDLGSTKEEIVKQTPKEIRKNLVASHPMAGTEKNGPSAAFETLYHDKIVVLCDVEDSGKKQVEITKEIFKKIGMKIVYMDCVSHDLHASYISHLPHAISYALANSILRQENPKNILTLAGGGFEGMVRIAKSSPVMWSDIFKQNKTNLLKTLDSFEDELKTMRKYIEEEKWDELKRWMSEANQLHNIL